MINKSAEKQKNKQNKPLFRKVLIVLVVATAGLFFVRLVFSNILAISGQRLAAANQKIEQLREENQRLENKISELNSLTRLEKIAGEKGFVKIKNVKVLVPSGPIANK